ncbi:MAG: hypothetical protein RMK52_06515 [Chitinophagales bacterium]|nr:hypothetical protein [Chitinophagales bacterium]MDW8393880.1 hypothetical protein [Chitinophagales bacterium]
MIKQALVLLLIPLLVLYGSCKCDRPPKVSHIRLELPVYRMEQELFSLEKTTSGNEVEKLAARYGDFFWFYFEEFGIHPTTPGWSDSVLRYATDTLLQSLFDSVQLRFADFSAYQHDLRRMMQYFRYYFPESLTPAIVTLINGPGRAAFTYGDTLLCINLDDYLGPASRFYRHQDIPNYLLRRFRPEYVLPNAAHVWATQLFPYSPYGRRLLDAMIANGKILYLKSKVLPQLPDSLITGFRQADLDWCRRNEPLIWKFFLDRDLLYEQDILEYFKYVTDGPNTSGMPPEAPGNVGTWVGWRIVTEYMKKNASVTLSQLMHETDAQKILDGASYKPR